MAPTLLYLQRIIPVNQLYMLNIYVLYFSYGEK